MLYSLSTSQLGYFRACKGRYIKGQTCPKPSVISAQIATFFFREIGTLQSTKIGRLVQIKSVAVAKPKAQMRQGSAAKKEDYTHFLEWYPRT